MAPPPTTQLLAHKGAASTTGQAIAKRFVDHGAKVILADTNLHSCEKIADYLNKDYNQTHHTTQLVVAHAKSCDVRKLAEIKQIINEEAKEIYKQDVDIFYNNACINEDDGAPTIKCKTFQETMKVNVEAVIASIEYASAVMRKNPNGGCILCTGTTTGLLGEVAPPSAYSISKTAVIGVVRAAAADLARHGVRVNVISPQRVAPNFDWVLLKQLFPKANGKELGDIMERYKTNPLVSKEDVANAAVYLASDASKGVTGHNLVLNGKFTLP